MREHSRVKGFDAARPALVLAAGASSRMGRAKILLPWAAGNLLDHAIDQARCLSSEVWVVAGCYYPVVRYRVKRRPSRWVYNRSWEEGIASSLKIGLDALPRNTQGVFILLADQPLITKSALADLRLAVEKVPRQPVAADYRGRPGVPAYLPRSLWHRVAALQGDRGAAQLLMQAGARTLVIPGTEADVDTPADWRRLRTV